MAELGDKTQLIAMVLAARYPWKKIFLGFAVAFALLNIGAVLVGKLIFTILPIFWVKLASGGLFLFFGVTTLLATKGYDEDEEGAEGDRSNMRGPVITAFLMSLVAELGDKTQLVTVSLAAQHNAPFAVFFGSTLALWLVSLIGVFLGHQLAGFIPLSYVRRGAGCIFLAFGTVVIYQAFTSI